MAAAACAVLSCAVPAAGDESRIFVVSGPQRSYREAAAALIETLERQGHSCVRIELPDGDDAAETAAAAAQLSASHPTVVATAGARATSWALQTIAEVPVVFFMVPNALDAEFVDKGHRQRVTGVAADVSPETQIDWILRLQPTGRHIAVPYSERTDRTLEALQAEAQKRGLRLQGVVASTEAFPEMIEELGREDPSSVLMIPDAKVYNAAAVQRLLLWGIRHKTPVWAFSSSVVKAGATAGQFCDNRSVGVQAARLVQAVIRGRRPGELGIQYAEQVDRAVNRHTAEMIGLELPESALGPQTTVYGERP